MEGFEEEMVERVGKGGGGDEEKLGIWEMEGKGGKKGKVLEV